MRRADRFLQLLQILRRHRQPVTADTLAGELEVSVRTIYRDIAALQASRVPVRGEAGVGYVLEHGFDMPPLMFTADELEAVLVGMRWVELHGDRRMADAAGDVLAKVAAVLPEALRPVLLEGTLTPPAWGPLPPDDRVDVGAIRTAIREQKKLAIRYHDEKAQETRRTIWPLGLAYFNMSRVVVAWCELRADFRTFRTDRMSEMEISSPYPGNRKALLQKWQIKAEATDEPKAATTAQQTAGGRPPAGGIKLPD